MTEKTARQIESMKQQTIGVEIEMNNITPGQPRSSPLSSSELTTTQTQPAGTATAPRAHGTKAAGNGNSRRM